MVSCVSSHPAKITEVALAASVKPASVQDQASASYALKVLAEGFNSSMVQASTVVVSDQASFGRQWRSINPAMAEVPELDFSNSHVVFAFMGQRRSGGYYYEATLQEAEGLPVLVLVESTPGLKEAVTMGITSPYIVMQLVGPVEEISVKFEEKSRK